MATPYDTEFQKGVRAALAADTTVMGMVGTRIYDEPPEDPTYPFIRFGEIRSEPYDTDAILGGEVRAILEVHSRPATSGSVECKEITNAVGGVLHRNESAVTLTTGYDLIELRVDSKVVSRGSDGRSYLGLLDVYAMIDGGT